MMATSTTSPSQHLSLFGRGVRRLVLTQPPHFRTGTPCIEPSGPSPEERKAINALANSRFDLTAHLARNGATFPVGYLPDPLKAQTKKIPAGAATPLGNSFNQIEGMK